MVAGLSHRINLLTEGMDMHKHKIKSAHWGHVEVKPGRFVVPSYLGMMRAGLAADLGAAAKARRDGKKSIAANRLEFARNARLLMALDWRIAQPIARGM